MSEVLEVNRDQISMHPKERANGRENYDFYCFLVWPMIETYWLVMVSMFAVSWNEFGFSVPMLVLSAQEFGRTLYYEGKCPSDLNLS